MNKVGKRIKHARKLKGFTQEQLAEMVGVQKSAVAKWENGRVSEIKRSNLKKLAESLDLEYNELLDPEETEAIESHTQYVNDKAESDRIVYDSLSSTGNYNADFSTNIKSLRNTMKLSLAEMSEEIGISVSDLQKYEDNSVSDVPLSALVKFADFFNTSIEDLIGIKYIIPGKSDATVTLISGNPKIISNQEKWQKEVGTIEFSEDELDKLIEYAKLLISARK